MAITIAPSTETYETFTLFTVESTGEQFTVQDRAWTRVVLKWLRVNRKEGADAATDYLLETVLGEEQYDKLLDCEDVDKDDLSAIVDACAQIVLGNYQKTAEKGE